MNKRGYYGALETILLMSILLVAVTIVSVISLPFLDNFLTGFAVENDSCEITKIYWSAFEQTSITIKEGENINLIIEGENCNGQQVDFKIFTSQGNLVSSLGTATITNNIATKTWTATSTFSNYYFTADLLSDDSTIVSNDLEVLPLSGDECNDGIDNDGDGWVDYDFDPGCVDAEDSSESNTGTGFQCSDGLDNNNNNLIDGFDPGCFAWFDGNENQAQSSGSSGGGAGGGAAATGGAEEEEEEEEEEENTCEYHNEEITSPTTCDYRFSLQNSYLEEDLSYLGIANTGWTISGGFLVAGVGETVDEFIDATEEEIRDSLLHYIDRPDMEITADTTDFVILDMEHPIQPFNIWTYDENTVPTQNEVIDAFSLRIKVAREELPNAKLSMYGLIVGTKTGVVNDAHTNRMSGFIAAGERGMYDQLDVITPVLYQWHPPNHPDHDTLEQFTRLVIESSNSLERTNGQSIPLAPVLGPRYREEDPDTGEIVWITEEDQLLQLSVIQEYDSIDLITYWSQEETLSEFPTYFESIKAVPCECAP